jgi:hypothetical protein
MVIQWDNGAGKEKLIGSDTGAVRMGDMQWAYMYF